MKNFEYAHPHTESEAIQLLSETQGSTAVLAGGTDLVGLMKRSIATPDRVVNITDVASFQQIELDGEHNLWVGAAVHLDEFADDDQANVYPAVKQIIQGISSIQLQSQGTVVGELLRRPMCWYFRNGHDPLEENGKLISDGDNRYHAILGNRGPAKFVSASRLAPVLIALNAKLRVVSAEGENIVDLADLYQTPWKTGQSEFTLGGGELVTHVILPPSRGRLSAAYEVRHGAGPDQPLVAAATSLEIQRGLVTDARILLGQVAPTPWDSIDAARSLVGQAVTPETAERAGVEALAGAMALSQNEYKIELAQVAVTRSILRAVGMDTGGFC